MRSITLDSDHTPACEKLWRSVLEMAIKDSLKLQRCNDMDYEKASIWILRKTDDFKLVCDLAGYCPHRVHKNFLKVYKKRIRRDEYDC